MRGWKAREEAAKRRSIKTKISPEARAERKALYDAAKAINARPDEHYDDPHRDPVIDDVEAAGEGPTVADAKRPKTLLRGAGKSKRVVNADEPAAQLATSQDASPIAAQTAAEPAFEPLQDSEGALHE